MKEYAEGNFEGRVIYHSIEDGTTLKPATDYVEIPQDVLDKVKEYEQKIINGEIEPADSIIR